MKFALTFFYLFLSIHLVAQDILALAEKSYKEDQWYAGISFLLADESIEGFRLNGVSQSFSIGFIKDISLNNKSNRALGIGLGYGINNYGSNLSISIENNNSYGFSLIESIRLVSKNRLVSHFLEVPIEFRWRTSTATTYKFWRIYSGYLLRYNFFSRIKPFYDPARVINEVNPISHALKFSTGYNTWNIYFEYSLTPFFKSGTQTNLGTPLEMNSMKIGLIFYVL
ncbi:MAG: outer membrane beta-barrel protein [Flavobacteriaceae bacterium]|nr:outer membrane beta-barrel protein [Flavobacteriaceae bacterium]